MEIQQEEEIIFMDDRPLSYKLAAPEGIHLHVSSQDDNLFGAQHEENVADVTGYFKLVEDQEEEQDDLSHFSQQEQQDVEQESNNQIFVEQSNKLSQVFDQQNKLVDVVVPNKT